ncbi:MAG TPA: glycosyltransferase [Candidatus Binatia bacterium]|jgi:glycosyltransferase involved in cell wall biosynthesis/predicted Ser/Thr protein kinase
MQFNPQALESKRRHLDAILADRPRLTRVVGTLVGDATCEVTPIARPWEPGGGASLFKVATASASYFLKVKHLAVTVESKLESEPAFSREPSLRNEHRFLQRLAGLPFVPTVHGYVEEGDHAFLLLEWLAPFESAVAGLGAGALVDAFAGIEAAARALYERGIVHTDLHEKNLLFRSDVPVLADFEEARDLVQTEPFTQSLDVVGKTANGDVGEMPSGEGRLGGLTCLTRLRAVFVALVQARLELLVASCNFDSSCPFLTALDHGKDERVYQSIQIPGLAIAGQRPVDDPRIPIIAAVAAKLFDGPYTHLDVGSNVGMFNIALARQPQVRRSIGVEAYDKYVELSKALAFVAGVENVAFHCAVGGEDSLAERLRGERVDLVTIYSMYHHIRDKQRFLADLATLAPSYVMLEMASQPECYEGRSWQSEVEVIRRELGMPFAEVLGQSADYQRPIVLLAKQPIPADLLATPRRVVPAAKAVAPAAKAAAPAPRSGPRVTVVLPVYNHRALLPGAITSVLAQTYTDFELVIVNDGSTDGTREYLDGLTDPRIVVVHQENQRLPGALNAGFARARGELLTWTSADNTCAPMFLEALVGALDHYPEAGFAYSAFAWIDAKDRITGIHRDQEVTVRALLKQNPGIAAFLYRRECQDAVGMYDPALDGAEDWDMWLRIVERYPAVYVPEILYYYRLHDNSMTATKRDQIAQASRAVVANALARRGGRLDMHELFPALPDCGDRGEAEFWACLDFGTALLQSPWAPADLAVSFLDAACSIQREAIALANFAIACGRAGRWDEMRQALEPLRSTAQADLRRLVLALETAAKHGRADAVATISPSTFNHAGIELFERERAARRVFSLTEQGGAPPKPLTPAKAPMPRRDAAPAPRATAASAAPPAARPAVSTPPAPPPAAVAAPRTPMVSVIVPTLDRPETLREAIESILQQTYRDFEIIVVNDGGADVAALVQSLDTEGRISYVRHPANRNLAAARNSGIGVARGKYIAYLDDDDRFYPEHLETLVAFLEQGSHRAAYTDALRVTQTRRDGRYVTVARDRPYSNDHDRDWLLVRNAFPVLCMMHDRACIEAVGGFDEALTSHEDWDLWVRMSARFPFKHLPTITAEFTHRVDGSSMTSGARPDFLRTAESVYQKSAADVVGRTDIQQAREQFLRGLRAQIGAPSPAPRPAPTGAAATRATGDADAFDCSIVIPLFNRAELTEQCLVNLAEVTQGARYEVVLVDNGSTDRTAEVLASLGGDVQVIRNAENRGFAAACNQGARAARGRHLVFLNNDTIPLSGWLAPLLAELDGDPRVAVVGSKLLYADGTVQHAGVIFTREIPIPYHVFYRSSADAPAVNRRREIHCVTAASMAVRRAGFEAIGGFDEGFVNGYEDVDFCLRVRQRGDKVVYQPASTLYHLESQTPGRKDHDDANGRRLLERWGGLWWRIGDEDTVLVPEGLAARTRADGAKVLAPITDAAERHRWEAVCALQLALLGGDASGARRLLAEGEWPDDAGVRRWLEQVRAQIGAAGSRPDEQLPASA